MIKKKKKQKRNTQKESVNKDIASSVPVSAIKTFQVSTDRVGGGKEVPAVGAG